MTVRRDKTPESYWLQIKHADVNTESMVLFDPVKLIILRHVLLDNKGGYLAEVKYTDYQRLNEDEENKARQNSAPDVSFEEPEGFCMIPGSLSISSWKNSEKVDLKLHSFMADAHFLPTDFMLEIPENFEQLLIR